MRIVGGSLSGRRFRGPPADRTRPTSERVREAIASALAARDRIEGARVLDLYAGTGALAFEALSRGAESAVLVERERDVAKVLALSARELGLESRVRIEQLDLHGPAKAILSRLARDGGRPFELVFADPPYAEIERVPPLLEALVQAGIVAPDALVVLEHGKKQPPRQLGRLACIAAYEYGDTTVAFLVPSQESNAPAP